MTFVLYWKTKGRTGRGGGGRGRRKSWILANMTFHIQLLICSGSSWGNGSRFPKLLQTSKRTRLSNTQTHPRCVGLKGLMARLLRRALWDLLHALPAVCKCLHTHSHTHMQGAPPRLWQTITITDTVRVCQQPTTLTHMMHSVQTKVLYIADAVPARTAWNYVNIRSALFLSLCHRTSQPLLLQVLERIQVNRFTDRVSKIQRSNHQRFIIKRQNCWLTFQTQSDKHRTIRNPDLRVTPAMCVTH